METLQAEPTEMVILSQEQAEADLPGLLRRVAGGSEPLLIRGEHDAAVLVSEEEWRGIQETLYLLSIPGMRESIIEGLAAPASDFDEDPGW